MGSLMSGPLKVPPPSPVGMGGNPRTRAYPGIGPRGEQVRRFSHGPKGQTGSKTPATRCAPGRIRSHHELSRHLSPWKKRQTQGDDEPSPTFRPQVRKHTLHPAHAVSLGGANDVKRLKEPDTGVFLPDRAEGGPPRLTPRPGRPPRIPGLAGRGGKKGGPFPKGVTPARAPPGPPKGGGQAQRKRWSPGSPPQGVRHNPPPRPGDRAKNWRERGRGGRGERRRATPRPPERGGGGKSSPAGIDDGERPGFGRAPPADGGGGFTPGF